MKWWLLSWGWLCPAVWAGPAGWTLECQPEQSYALSSQAASGGKLAVLQSQADTPRYALVYQTVDAVPWRKLRLSWSAQLQCRQVQGWAALWMRVESAEGEVLAFDNMQDRPARGDTQPQRLGLEMQIPPQADRLVFGFLLSGRGLVKVDQGKFQVMGGALPAYTERKKLRGWPALPANLDFDA